MNQSSTSSTSRLDRLEGFLREDPANPNLLADACEAALQAGQHDRALMHIRSARALGLDRRPWDFLEAQVYIAQNQLQAAQALLETLRMSRPDDPAVAHDLAYIKLLQNDFEACRILVEPWIGDAAAQLPVQQADALQALWLRAAHRLQLLDEAWAWAEAQAKAGRLQPAAAGVASLIAIDADHYKEALALSERALEHQPRQLEALVARATVALAQQNMQLAVQLLNRALESNPQDGRTWSALGFASMQAKNLPLAQTQLERALETMPAHVGTWLGLGWARLLQGNAGGATQAFEQALALDRNYSESHACVALVLAMRGEQAEAQKHLDLADRLDRANVFGRFVRALIAGEIRDGAQVRDLFIRLLDMPGPLDGRLSDWIRALNR